jgi:hypothetical protein
VSGFIGWFCRGNPDTPFCPQKSSPHGVFQPLRTALPPPFRYGADPAGRPHPDAQMQKAIPAATQRVQTSGHAVNPLLLPRTPSLPNLACGGAPLLPAAGRSLTPGRDPATSATDAEPARGRVGQGEVRAGSLRLSNEARERALAGERVTAELRSVGRSPAPPPIQNRT